MQGDYDPDLLKPVTMKDFRLFVHLTLAPPPVMFHEWDELNMAGDTGDARYWLTHSGAMCAHQYYGKWWIWRNREGTYNGGMRVGRDDDSPTAVVSQLIVNWSLVDALAIAQIYNARLSDG